MIEELILLKSNKKRCELCDTNLKGSVWKNVYMALKIKTKNRTRYHCVRCITKNRKRWTKTPQELDNFVENLPLKQLKH
jgi:hypothetical protein